MATDARWKEVYDRQPSAHFAFLAVNNPRAIAGHLSASTDASGRRFPFVTAGAFDVGAPLEFMPHAPMVLARLWSRFEQAARSARAGRRRDPGARGTSHNSKSNSMSTAAYDASVRDFIELESIGSLQVLLRQAGHPIDLRQTMLALGLLLQPVLASDGQSLSKGLSLPLPADPFYRPVVATFWLELVVPFLQRGDFEVALFLPRSEGPTPPTLAISFSGGSAAHLRAILDPIAAQEAFVDPTPADWVEDQVRDDYAVKKLSSYLQQPQLSLRQAMATFREAFLGE